MTIRHRYFDYPYIFKCFIADIMSANLCQAYSICFLLIHHCSQFICFLCFLKKHLSFSLLALPNHYNIISICSYLTHSVSDVRLPCMPLYFYVSSNIKINISLALLDFLLGLVLLCHTEFSIFSI